MAFSSEAKGQIIQDYRVHDSIQASLCSHHGLGEPHIYILPPWSKGARHCRNPRPWAKLHARTQDALFGYVGTHASGLF